MNEKTKPGNYTHTGKFFIVMDLNGHGGGLRVKLRLLTTWLALLRVVTEYWFRQKEENSLTSWSPVTGPVWARRFQEV
jgi:hypothetical protein